MSFYIGIIKVVRLKRKRHTGIVKPDEMKEAIKKEYFTDVFYIKC